MIASRVFYFFFLLNLRILKLGILYSHQAELVSETFLSCQNLPSINYFLQKKWL